ncbi:MAG TPA: hypothetical protein VF950_27585 [Planctomycetota bacterium]
MAIPASPLELLCELERGPRGVLYRARDGRFGRQVSLRVSPPSWPQPATLLAATRASVLDHPHIAPMLEAGWHDDAAYVIFGEDLGARVNPVALSPREAVGIARDVATAVAYAAARGLDHPGLVPDLLRFTPTGRVVVTGYEMPFAPDGPELYRAPEVRNGAAVDAAANVYSLGAILYVLAQGCRLDARVPEALETLIREAMDVDPRRRPTAAELAEKLARRLEPQATPKPVRRAWKDALVATGLLALLSLGLARPMEEKPPPQPEASATACVEPEPEVEASEPEAVEAPPAPARVGTVKHVHPEYGVFVELEADTAVDVGDTLEAVRDGEVVNVLTVRQLSRPEKLYPHGAAVCDVADVEAGQVVRRRALDR